MKGEPLEDSCLDGRPPADAIGRRRFLGAALAVPASMALIACGGSSSSSDSAGTRRNETTDAGRPLDGLTVDVWRDPG